MKYLIRKPTIILSAVLCFSSAAFADHQIPATASEVGLLGAGYSSRDQSVRTMCGAYDPKDVEWKGLNQSSFDFKISSSSDEVTHDLGLEIDGKYRTGVIETSASAKFSRNTKSVGNSISYVWVSQYEFAPLQLTHISMASDTKSILNPEPQSWLKLDPNSPTYHDDLWAQAPLRIVNPDRFFQSCGDEVIYKQEVHAKLYINIRVDFASEEEANEFKTNINFSSPAVALNTDIKNLTKHFSSKSKFTFSALQIGGDTSAITRMFGSGNQTNGFGVVQCSFGDMTACQTVLKNAIDYAANDFSKQIPATDQNMKNLIGTPQGPAITMSYSRDWREANLRLLGDLSPQAKEMNAEVKRQLQEKFEKIFEQWHHLVRIAEVQIPRLNVDQERTRAINEANAYTSLKTLKQAIQVCYDRPLECVEANDKIDQSKIKVLEDIDFVFAPRSYAQFCDSVKVNQLYVDGFVKPTTPPQSMIDSVNVLNKIAESKDSTLLTATDYCGSVENALAAMESIDLSKSFVDKMIPNLSGQFDFRVLAPLPNLQQLDLSGWSLQSKDLSGLSLLTKLVVLNLDDNRISNVEFLRKLQKLETLKLNQNPVGDLSPLATLSSMKLLELQNTGDDTVCPFTNRTEVCDLIDYSTKGRFSHVRDYSTSFHYGHQALRFGDGVIRIFGGRAGSYDEQYDPNLNNLVEISNSKTDRIWFTSTMFGDSNSQAFLYGGTGNSIVAMKYSNTNGFSAVRPIEGSSRIFHRAELLRDGKILVFGGFPNSASGSTGANALLTSVLFDPSKNLLMFGPSMKESRAHHQSVVLDDGRVLVTGGVDRNGSEMSEGDRVSNSAEVFDGIKFTRLSSHMSSPRFLHQMTKLSDGRVLITGGFSVSKSGKLQTPLKSAELFDPKTNKFSKLPDMHFEHAAHQAILLDGGQVLVIGGIKEFTSVEDPNPATAETSAEVFDPIRNRFVTIGVEMISGRAFFTATDIGDRRILLVGGIGNSATSAEVFSYDF